MNSLPIALSHPIALGIPEAMTSAVPKLSSEQTYSFVDVSRPQTPDYNQSTPQSLSRAVYNRRAEYTRPFRIKVKVGSWNVAACPNVESDIKDWFVEGKGVVTQIAGLNLGSSHVEPVGAQEERFIGMKRRGTGDSTLPIGDSGEVVGGDEVGLYVLGLQEIVSLSSAKEYIGRVYVDNGPVNVWKEACGKAVPKGYELVSESQMSGLLLLIYASPTIAPTISNGSSTSVGTGVMGYLGNKGAVCTRIVLGETTSLVFINAHLASGIDKQHLERRVWDWSTILSRTKFAAINRGGVVDDNDQSISDADFAFVFGDLNFRLEGLPGNDIRRLLMLHTKGEYDIGSKQRASMDDEIGQNAKPIVIHSIDSEDDEISESGNRSRASSDVFSDLPDPDDFVQDPHNDPTSLQATLDSLIPHDQLKRMQRQKKAFHDGWREGPITFLPTYKYDVGSYANFDSGEKQRSPSWCDRILFRTRKDKEDYEKQSKEAEEAKKRDEEMKSRGLDEEARNEEVIFDYDPEADGTPHVIGSYDEYDYDENEDTTAGTIAELDNQEIYGGPGKELQLDVYTSHQRVLSSDHKPLSALFTLSYDAVVPSLKSRIHAEVARELDRAENEQRPTITILVNNAAQSGVGAWPEPTTTDAAMGVDFCDVGYLRRKMVSLTIANTGAVTAKFSFIPRPGPEGEQIKPDWLSFRFVDSYEMDGEKTRLENEVSLMPGDTITANLEVFVDKIEMVRKLNNAEILLDDILVLRVTDGRDYFIPLRGSWLPSPFGRSMDELIRIPPTGTRKLKGKISMETAVTTSAPRELVRLTEAIESIIERAVAEKSMVEELSGYTPDGWPFEATTPSSQRHQNRGYVLDALETDQPLLDAFPIEVGTVEKVEILAEVLLPFLGSISDGLVAAECWEKIDPILLGRKTMMQPDELKSLTLDVLSEKPHHHISLVFLTACLQKIVVERCPSVPQRSTSGESYESRESRESGRSGEADGGNGGGSGGGGTPRKRDSIRKSIGSAKEKVERAKAHARKHSRGKSQGGDVKNGGAKVGVEGLTTSDGVQEAKRVVVEKKIAELVAPVVVRSSTKGDRRVEVRKMEVLEAMLLKD